MELQLLHVTNVRRSAASQNGHMSRDMIGLFWSEVTVRVAGLSVPGTAPRDVFVIRLLIEKSLVWLVRVAVGAAGGELSLTLIVSWEAGRSAGSVLTRDPGLMARGMLVSLTKVGGGAGGDVWGQ